MANGIGGIMANYLIDTNIFFELLCGLAGKENINKKSDLDTRLYIRKEDSSEY